MKAIAVDPDEPFAANVVRLGDAVLCEASAPKTATRLERFGLDVRTVDMSELAKAEGALTCCLASSLSQTDDVAAFVIANITIDDPVRYEDYKRMVPATAGAVGGRFVARGGQTEVLEGDWRPNPAGDSGIPVGRAGASVVEFSGVLPKAQRAASGHVHGHADRRLEGKWELESDSVKS